MTYSVDLPRAGLFAAALMAKAHIPDVMRHAFFRCYAEAVGFYGVAFLDGVLLIHQGGQEDGSSVSATPLTSYQLKLPPIEERPY